MACGSCAQRAAARAGRPTYEVVSKTGKVLFSSPSKPTADAVSRRYQGSKVEEAGKAKTPVGKTDEAAETGS
ncbi:hypothetical protein [Streptomyces sp. NPDC047070]|uniref:hypothetical protein n=1 Tax=Streptomyces sp. NPDC047070 TaxID=3154923 RepID=UPI0034570AD9